MTKEQQEVNCPFCDVEGLKVLFIKMKFVKGFYAVEFGCDSCGAEPKKIETALNKSASRTRIRTEKSYMKVAQKDKRSAGGKYV